MGLMSDSMAMPPPEETGLVPAGQQTAQTPPTGGDGPDVSYLESEGEMEPAAYEDMADRTLLAALKVLSTPQLLQQQAELLQNPTGEAVGTFVFDVLTALQEKAAGKIDDEVMPAVLFGVLASIAEAGDLPPPVVAEASQRALMKFLVKSGANPAEIESVIGQMDFNKIAQMAEAAPTDEPQPQQ